MLRGGEGGQENSLKAPKDIDKVSLKSRINSDYPSLRYLASEKTLLLYIIGLIYFSGQRELSR